jgi:hypothetical protein
MWKSHYDRLLTKLRSSISETEKEPRDNAAPIGSSQLPTNPVSGGQPARSELVGHPAKLRSGE